MRTLYRAILSVCLLLTAGQAQTRLSHLQFPANGSTNVQTPVTLAWEPVPGVLKYSVYVGHNLGTYDAFFTGETSATSASVNLKPGTYYVRVWTKQLSGVWAYTDSYFTVRAVAILTNPPDGATGQGASISFAWNQPGNATGNHVDVGTTKGGTDILSSPTGSTFPSALTVANSKKYYVRLWTQFPDGWGYTDSTFSTTDFRATLLQPLDHTYFPRNGTVAWTTGVSADSYSYAISASNADPSPGEVYSSGPLTVTQNIPAVTIPDGIYYIQLSTHTADGWQSQPPSRFIVGDALAHLSYPLNGATNVDPLAAFRWNAVANAQAYYLYIGSAPGLKDVVNSFELSYNAYQAPILQPGQLYYARLHTEFNGVWDYEDTTFVEGAAGSQMIYPADGAVNITAAVPFQWTAMQDAQGYQLKIGTTVGANDLFDSGVTMNTNSGTSIPAFPSGGKTYYITLKSERNGIWRTAQTSFVSGNGSAWLTQPSVGQTQFDPIAPFVWNPVAGAQSYYLWIGSSPGLKDIFGSGETSATSVVATGLKSNTSYWARLWTEFQGKWYFQRDVPFTTGTGTAQFVYPVNNQTGVDPFATFSWTPPSTGADLYWLMIGTTQGARDVWDSRSTPLTQLQPKGMLPNKNYYARLWTFAQNTWRSTDISFATGDSATSGPVNSAALLAAVEQTTATVRQMADINGIPVAGTPLATLLVSEGIKQAACTDYTAVMAPMLLQQGIAARRRKLTLNDTTTESHSTIEFYDPYTGLWGVADPTFAIVYYDPVAGTGQSVEYLSQQLVNGTLNNIKPIIVSSGGTTYANAYYMDPITLYLNYYPVAGSIDITPDGQVPPPPTTNDPTAYLTPIVLSSIADINGTYFGGNYLVKFQNATDSMVIGTAIGNYTLTPIDGTMYSRGVTLKDGWTINSAPANYQLLRFKRVMF